MGDVALPATTVATVLTQITDTVSPARYTVHDGVAPPEIVAPFVSVYPINPTNIGRGLASEDWGKYADRYQLSCFGGTVDQAVQLARLIIGLTWPDGWELDADIPAPITETEPGGTWVQVPLTFTYWP